MSQYRPVLETPTFGKNPGPPMTKEKAQDFVDKFTNARAGVMLEVGARAYIEEVTE